MQTVYYKKIEEVKIIALKTKAAVTGMSESKLDETVLKGEINLLRSDRIRHGGGVLCYIKNTIGYNRTERFSTEIENIFVDTLLPKTKPIIIGNVYPPPAHSGLLDKLSNAIRNAPNFDSQEVYIFGDLNINLNYTGRCVPNGV